MNSPSQPHASSSSTGAAHNYAPLPAADLTTVNRYLTYFHKDDRRLYKCSFPGCEREDCFTRGENARVHIQKHLGNDKLFYCLTCDRQFSSEDNAKRHRDGQVAGKIFQCPWCEGKYSRKDYRDHHEKKCAHNPSSHGDYHGDSDIKLVTNTGRGM